MKKILFFLLAFYSIVLISSCGGDDPVIEPPIVVTPMVKIGTNPTLGSILTDEKGNTLYFFSRDAITATCTGTCLDNWTPYNIETLSLGTGLVTTDFGSIDVAGKKQTTYKGWPLYLHKGDTAPGQANGSGQGNLWFVAKPDYSIMIMSNQLVGNDGKNYKSNYTEGEEKTTYFVDDKGRTLYAFIRDFKDVNVYTRPDLSNNGVWPIFEGPIANVPTGLNKSDFGSITVAGKTQMTYKGWPLYYFGQDGTARGINKGVSVPTPGVWPIVNANIQNPLIQKTVKEANHPTFGKIITDEAGKTLYFFSRDFDGSSACTGGCLTTWPPFYMPSKIAGAGLDTALFGVITKADGSKQSTYKGWPLYYYASDAAAGEVKGEAVGNVWFVAKPDYSIMLSNAQLIGHDAKKYNSKYEVGDEVTQYMVDANGRTLYRFVRDFYLVNKFTRADFSNDATWPIYQKTDIVVPSTLDKTLFKAITVAGKQQLTYNGHPLYYFGQDGTTKGANKGISFPTPGVWPIVNKATTIAACDTAGITYTNTIKPLMTTSCANANCHGGSNPASGIRLDTYAGVKASVNGGRILGAMNREQGFSPMPKNGAKLDKCSIDAMKFWIDKGAPEN
jgi:predicted lipoprotein with Yx(FWY)xxD motif